MTASLSVAARPMLTIVKGHPTDEEVAALTAVFAQLAAEARRDNALGGDPERNGWGRPQDRYAPAGSVQFNPSAFRNVRYY